MQGYYDDHPLVTLSRHLALAGLITPDTRRIAHQLACLNGLAFYDLDRLVEHHAGKTVYALALTRGPEHYREVERQVLRSVLADRPLGVVALGDGTLLDAASCRRVDAETTLIALERDLPNCYWRLQALKEKFPDDVWHPLHLQPLVDIEQVRPFYDERQPTLAGADHTVRLDGRPMKEAIATLMELVSEISATDFEPSPSAG